MTKQVAKKQEVSRYFAIVIKGDDSLRDPYNCLRAASRLGIVIANTAQLPKGFEVIRSIEITEEQAQKTW